MIGNPTTAKRIWLGNFGGLARKSILILVAQLCCAAPLLAQQSALAHNDPDATWPAFIRSPKDLTGLPPARQKEKLDRLGAAFIKDPASVSDALEAEIGGRAALRTYLYVMLQQGRHDDIAEQVRNVLHAGQLGRPFADILNTAEHQDGSIWFPLAEQAGFFLGGVAAVLDGKSDESASSRGTSDWFGADDARQDLRFLAEKLDMHPPGGNETAADWLLNALTNSRSGLSRPAAQWFEKGFRQSYR